MNEITFQDVYRTASELVGEFGAEFIYEKRRSSTGQLMCYYVKDGQGDCIVGRVLVKLGVSVDILRQYEGDGSWFVLRQLREKGWSINEEADMFLGVLQGSQDSGWTWGHSLREAQNALRDEIYKMFMSE